MKKQVQVKTNVLPWNDKIWVHIPFLKSCGLGFGKNSCESVFSPVKWGFEDNWED